MSDSPITLVGNIVRDPELRFGQNGTAVLSSGIAVNKRRQVNGEWEEETSFFNIVMFGTLAENAAASIGKGTRVVLSGELVQRPYETKEGESRSVVEVNVQAIGPDLRWATADVTKAAKSEGGASKPRQTRQQQALPDEEPF